MKGPSNKTIMDGDNVLLTCLTSGNPKPEVTWRRSGRQLLHSGHTNYEILNSGDLLLKRVGLLDEGDYTCSAKNIHGSQRSKTATLTVDVRPFIQTRRTIYNVTHGSQIELVCLAQGSPPPKMSWFKDGKQLPSKRTEFFHSVLSFTVVETATYTCQALTQLRSSADIVTDTRDFYVYVHQPIESEEKTSDHQPLEKDEHEVETEQEVMLEDGELQKEPVKPQIPQGYCSPYNGAVCADHLNDSGLIFYNFSGFSVHINEQISQGLWKELISSLMEPCRSAAERLLCYYAFPQCEMKNNFAAGKPLCKEDCIALRELFCYNQWAQIEDNKLKGIYFKSRGHFRLPSCADLPSWNSSSSHSCSYARLTELKEDEITTDCVLGRGRFYQGTVNVTKSGIPCQSWDSQEPHQHHRPPMVFPEVLNSENFCRNAGGEEPTPWCYTSDPMVRWQHCDIPLCTNSTMESSPEADPQDNFEVPKHPVFSPTFILVITAVCLTALVLVIMLILAFRRIRKYQRGYNATPTVDVDIDLDKLPSNISYHKTGARLNPKLEGLEFPRNNILYIRDIGQGAFGRVFQAKAPGVIKDEEFTMVAVKMLKEEASEDLQSDFEREACLLAEFDHPNIVKLLGVCAVGKPMCFLFEYMGRGDLNGFLRSCSPSNYIVRAAKNNIFSDVRLSHWDLVHITRQIAAGMSYLSERKFVHRDLATRNCLINDDMVVKISDFGLSQKIYTANYYKGSEHDAIPIRWMPLESILYNKFTVESDIWAFGIVVWEIFSFALQPYYGMTHEEVVKFIQEANVLSCPENTPPSIYNLMKKCWNKKPSNRPPFKIIYKILCAVHEQMVKNQYSGPTAHF
ncbi:tyrosine-protein kinase transmembrane receptor Ror2-like isoform X2 [Tachypleus tridentatus]